MNTDKINSKEKIFEAALELISGAESPEEITTRVIATKAGVNVALVNYYYQSKENLLSQIVGMLMGNIINEILQKDSSGEDAKMRLRSILLATADAAFKYYNVSKIAISVELKNGCMNSCKMIMPLLEEILEDYSKEELNIISLQLMMPFHHIMMDPELYNGYLNTDFFDEQKRKKKIDQMIDSALRGL